MGYAKAGCNCIPVDPKTKKPLDAWARWQKEEVPGIELAVMFEHACGIDVVCGAVSSGLEVIDFDEPSVFPFWRSLISEQTYKKLLVQRTQSGGFHVAYQCKKIGRNQKLAVQCGKTAIETRSEGGYIIAAPTPGYETVQGSWETLRVITVEEREYLIAAGRAFNENSGSHKTEQAPANPNQPELKPARPGDDFIARTSWEQILVRRHPERGRDIVVTDCKGNLLVEQGAMFGVERLGNEMRYYTLDGDPFEESYIAKEKQQPSTAAVDFIMSKMKGGDSKYASEMYQLANEQGVSKSSLHRAVQSLELQVRRVGARWTWRMPDPFE